MKKKLLLIVLFICSVANAQNANIPNPALKALLLNEVEYHASDNLGNTIIIDANNDDEIQVSEALAVWTLSIAFDELESLEGIEAFANLRTLYCTDQNLTELNVQGLQHLETLWCSDNQLQSLDVSNMITLKELRVGWNQLTSINIAGLTNLERLDVFGNNLSSIDYSDSPNLISMDLGGGNNFTSLTITGLNNLQYFTFDDNNINETLTAVTIANLPNLQHLQMGYGNMQTLELINLPSLTGIEAHNNPFTSLDLSQCPNLEQAYLPNTGLLYLNLKNGSNIINSLNLTDSSQLAVICVDEGEEDEVAEQLFLSNLFEVETVTSCPAFELNKITGVISFDADANGCGNGDPVMAWKKVNVSNGTTSKVVMTNNSGSYNFYGLTGDFTVMPIVNTSIVSVSPESAIISFTDLDNESIQNFCMNPIGTHNDVEIVIVPLEAARPGFDADYKVIYKNNGNQIVSGAVNLAFDDAVVDLISSIPAAGSQATGSLSWNFSNLMPDEIREIMLTYNVNGPMETPSVNIDDVLNYTATISIPVEDETPFNNSMGIKQVVVGSLDPNDITCLEGDTVLPGVIGEYLHYNINFENIGTAPATFVIVENDINALEFEISSLEILYASHEMSAIIEGNKLTCRFDDINLGANAKGNIVYKIKTLSTLEVNDAVTQKANIFFDYNFPLATNQAITTFATLGTNDFEIGAPIKVYPNPSNGIVNLSANMNIESYELYDTQGRLLHSAIVNDSDAKLDISQRAAGMYFIKVKTAAGSKVEKIVKE